MKKQPVRSKASELQQRLITRETYQLVNAKKFGTATSRNERQFEKKMRCLHTQQAKTLAKLRDEIYEVKIHHKMLKEVDQTAARDPRTVAEKTAEIVEDNVGNSGEIMELGKLNLRKSGRQGVIIRSHPPDGGRNRSLTMKDRSKSIPGLSPLPPNDPKLGAGNRIRANTITEGHKPTFLCGILNMTVKRDTGLVRRYNYNIKKAGKPYRCQQTMPEIAQNAKPSQVADNNRVNFPQSSGNCNGKTNRRTIGVAEGRPRAEATTKPSGNELTLRVGHRIYAPALKAVNKERKTVHHRGVTFPVYNARETGTENETSSDDVGPEEDPSQSEDWGAMLSECRYLRRPKGYETPEETIEAVFR